MAQFASAAFTGTDATTLATADANWTVHPVVSGTAQIAANRVRVSTTTTSAYYHSGAPATADYSVSADLFTKEGNGGASSVGPCGRVDTAANTLYHVRYAGASAAWQLYKFVAGTATLLGSSAQALTDETTYNVKLEMVGSAIKLFKELESVALISVTDTAITAAGKSGIRIYPGATPSDILGLHIDNFSADDAASGDPALTGQSTTIQQGSVVPSVSPALSGQSTAIQQGSLTVDTGTVSLTGQSVGVNQGSLVASVSPAITGQSVTVAQGSLAPSVSPAITGQAVTVAQGAVVASVAPSLTGNVVALQQGTVSVFGASVTVALTGQSVSVSQGMLVAPPPDSNLLGGAPSRKRRDLDKDSYLYRLLSPLPNLRKPEREQVAEVIEQAAEEAVSKPQLPTIETVQETMQRYRIAYRQAYGEIYMQLVAEMRREQEDEDAAIAEVLAMLL